MSREQIIKEIDNKIKDLNSQGIKQDQMTFSYARVSTEDQKEKGNSVNDQIAYASQYAKKKGLNIIHFFQSAESAFKTGREVFNLMFELAEKYNIRNILFKNYDRMARNSFDWAYVSELIKSDGYIIHFYEQDVILSEKSTAEQFLMGDMGNMFAKYWSNKISQSVKYAYQAKVYNRAIPVNAPLGYKWNKNIKNFEINENKRSIIDIIFDKYDNENYTMVEIADLLNAYGYKTSKGYNYRKQTVQQILKNPFYCGKFKYKGDLIKGTYETYITPERFEERIEKLNRNFRGHKKGNTNFLLRKFIKCEHCGKLLSGVQVRGRFIYYNHKCNDPDIGKKQTREEKLIQIIDNEVEKHFYCEKATEWIKKYFKRAFQASNSVYKNKDKDLNIKIEDLKNKKNKLYDIFVEDDRFNKDELHERIEQINIKINKLEEERNKVSDSLDKYQHKVVDLIDYLRNFTVEYIKSSNKDKIKLLRVMAEGMIINKRGELKILWYKPFKFLFNKKVTGKIPVTGKDLGFVMQAQKDSNLQPTVLETATLPIGPCAYNQV